MDAPRPRIQVWLGIFTLHFLLILSVAWRETFGLVASGHTMLPARLNGAAVRAESCAALLVGDTLDAANPARQVLKGYLHASGIAAGYGFFAPNVPESYKLLFELYFADGHLEYDSIVFDHAESSLRFTTLLDEIGQTESDALRQVMIKLLAHSIWRLHPEAVKIRAIFGSTNFPTPADFRPGTKESYEFLFAYDFVLSGPAP